MAEVSSRLNLYQFLQAGRIRFHAAHGTDTQPCRIFSANAAGYQYIPWPDIIIPAKILCLQQVTVRSKASQHAHGPGFPAQHFDAHTGTVGREKHKTAVMAVDLVYYAGHAFPDEESKNAYLMPVDGDSKNSRTGYGLERLYKELGSVQTRQVVCFIDACFSGATRDDKLILTGRGVAITVKDDIPQGNMVVMTSATGAETAHQYEEMHHGMFTYYLLQKLQETNGDVTLGELSSFVTKMVKRKSVIINQKMQTPTVIPSPKLQATWQTLKLN